MAMKLKVTILQKIPSPMRNTNKLCPHLFLLFFILIGCNPSLNDKEKKHKVEGDSLNAMRCEFTYDENGVKNGKYICFYPDSGVWVTGTLKNDSFKIYEEITYFLKNGSIKEYHFYNPAGEPRYRRLYNDKGQVIKEEGDILSHNELSKPQFSVKDSAVLKIFVATPPGITYKIYGGDSQKGRYELGFNQTDTSYFQKRSVYAKKEGNYVLPYEVEITDTIRGTREIRKGSVSFKVIK
jgi:hypothetical protein